MRISARVGLGLELHGVRSNCSPDEIGIGLGSTSASL